MNVSTTQENGFTEIVIEGSIDSKTAPLVKEKITPALDAAQNVLLNLSQVDYLSSAGLRLLLLIYRAIAAKSRKLVLLGVSEEIQTVMSHTGFLKFFELADSRAAAIQSFS